MYTQEWIDSLPRVSTKEAIKNKIKYFVCSRGCGACGCPVRLVSGISFQLKNIYCANCCKLFKDTGVTFEKRKPYQRKSPVKMLSVGSVNSNINIHNESVKLRKKDSWGIPVVFGGLARN